MRKNFAKLRIVIDTNVWVNHVMAGLTSNLVQILGDPTLEVFSSAEMRDELFNTLKKERLKKYVKPGVLRQFLADFPTSVTEIEVKSTVFACRDVKDNFLLELAKDANADFLLSHDKDLLVLNPFGKTRIMRLPEFLEWLQTNG